MKKIIVLLSLLLIVACTPTVEDEQAAVIEDVDEPTDAPVEVVADEEEEVIEEAPEEEVEEEPSEIDDTILSLVEKFDALKSYEFYSEETKHTYKVKGYNMIVELIDFEGPVKDHYNKVYLNRADKEAFRFCEDRQVCNPSKRYYKPADYDEYIVDEPITHLKKVIETSTDVNIVGDIICESTQCIILEYNDGKNKMLVRENSGVPYKVLEIETDGTEVILHQYNDVAVNHIKDAEAVLPEKYSLAPEDE